MIDDLTGTMTSVLRTSLLYRSRIRNMNYKVSKHSHKITSNITRCAVYATKWVHSCIPILLPISHLLNMVFHIPQRWIAMLSEFPFSFTERLKNINLAQGVLFGDTIPGNLLRNVTEEYVEINAHMLKTHNLIFLESLMVPRIYSGNFIIQTSISGGCLTMQNIPLVI